MDPYKQLAEALDIESTPTGRFLTQHRPFHPYGRDEAVTSTLAPGDLGGLDYEKIERHIMAQLAAGLALPADLYGSMSEYHNTGKVPSTAKMHMDFKLSNPEGLRALFPPPIGTYKAAPPPPRPKDSKAAAKRRAKNKARSITKGRR